MYWPVPQQLSTQLCSEHLQMITLLSHFTLSLISHSLLVSSLCLGLGLTCIYHPLFILFLSQVQSRSAATVSVPSFFLGWSVCVLHTSLCLSLSLCGLRGLWAVSCSFMPEFIPDHVNLILLVESGTGWASRRVANL